MPERIVLAPLPNASIQDAPLPAMQWLTLNWYPAGVVAGIFYLLCLPFFHGWTALTLLAALQLPMYIIHQVEEHYHDRFRRYVNATVGHGLQALTPVNTMFINVVYVWAVEFLTLYLAAFVRPGLMAIIFFLTLVNALAHIAGAIRQRAYNPGLTTSVLLFLPSSTYGLLAYRHAGLMSTPDLLLGLSVGILIHVAIIIPVLRRRTMLEKTLIST